MRDPDSPDFQEVEALPLSFQHMSVERRYQTPKAIMMMMLMKTTVGEQSEYDGRRSHTWLDTPSLSLVGKTANNGEWGDIARASRAGSDGA